ncbi:MAG: GNAT family N-acetyltransferase [Microbacterium sp.]|uniref:GNAT family N-acetyltransferase n=1 Tax=Microbacterium sp. TaxID=51671 RepID=UPI003F97BF14
MLDLGDGLGLRPIQPGDGAALAAAYARNRAHLERWDPVRDASFYTAERQEQIVAEGVEARTQNRAARFVVVSISGEVMGTANIMNIVHGAAESADLGYWIDAALTGRGLMSTIVASLAEHARDELGLHRLQASTLLENERSQRVLLRNGFEKIGMAPKYLRIAGEWQDHFLFQRIL